MVRSLYLPDISQRRRGALAAIYRHISKNLKAGVGYNFTNSHDTDRFEVQHKAYSSILSGLCDARVLRCAAGIRCSFEIGHPCSGTGWVQVNKDECVRTFEATPGKRDIVFDFNLSYSKVFRLCLT